MLKMAFFAFALVIGLQAQAQMGDLNEVQNFFKSMEIAASPQFKATMAAADECTAVLARLTGERAPSIAKDPHEVCGRIEPGFGYILDSKGMVVDLIPEAKPIYAEKFECLGKEVRRAHRHLIAKFKLEKNKDVAGICAVMMEK